MRALGLEYHDVIAGADSDASGFPGVASASYKLPVCDFTRHLAAIAAAGVVVAGIDRLAMLPPGATPVFLTFDDGGVGAVSETAPLLGQRGWTGHFFVTTGCIGTRGFLQAAEIVALRALGHVVGSHSCTHPLRFSSLPVRAMLREWKESRVVLEQILREEVRAASVPGGQFRRAAAETAAEAGYRVLFTSEPVSRVYEVDGCLVLGRYSLRRTSSAAVAGAIVTARTGVRADRKSVV